MCGVYTMYIGRWTSDSVLHSVRNRTRSGPKVACHDCEAADPFSSFQPAPSPVPLSGPPVSHQCSPSPAHDYPPTLGPGRVCVCVCVCVHVVSEWLSTHTHTHSPTHHFPTQRHSLSTDEVDSTRDVAILLTHMNSLHCVLHQQVSCTRRVYGLINKQL